MKIDCIKRCKPGDIIYIYSVRYLVTSEYINAFHESLLLTDLDGVYGYRGFINLKNMDTNGDTYLVRSSMGCVTRIVKTGHQSCLIAV